MGKIIQLDRHVADLIAAGEVVERPASVVKELVENSMDAGATSVTVEIKRGGLELIRVTDNGSGIAPDDIRAAFCRHATSKIRTADDLTAIATMGFRGEALASIASVAKVAVFTRSSDATAGVCYEIEGGSEISLEEAGCPDGTTFLVRELFYNTPARMKFIKKDVTEAGQALTVVRRAALARPDISFKLIRDGEEMLHTPGDHSLISAIYCVYGGPFAAGFEKVGVDHEGVRVVGYVSKPAYGQGSRAKQEFFVNARPVRSRILSAALEEAYKNRMMVNRYPACVLHIEINPAVLDVNVHPAKSEIKFAFERQAFDAVYLAVKDAVDAEDARPGIVSSAKPPQFEAPPKENFVQTTVNMANSIPTGDTVRMADSDRLVGVAHQTEPPQQDFFREMTSEAYRSTIRGAYRPAGVSALPPQNAPTESTASYRPTENAKNETAWNAETAANTSAAINSPSISAIADASYAAASDNPLPVWKILGEAFDTYILVEDGDDILFVDKHAAHERILFEQLKARADQPVTQLLMEPIVLRFDRDELDALLSNRELLGGTGFEFEEFGGDSVLVRGLPDEIDRFDASAALQEIAAALIENRRSPLTQRREDAMRLIACKAALKAGSCTTYAEKRALVERVMRFDDIKYCPHGRPVAAVLKKSEIERRFGRI